MPHGPFCMRNFFGSMRIAIRPESRRPGAAGPTIVPRRSVWRFAGMIVSCLTVLLMSGTAIAATPQELLEQADRLARDDETFPDSSRRALGLYEDISAIEPHNAA